MTSTAHAPKNALTRIRQVRRVALAMREDHGPDHERHEMWAVMSTLLFMAADHLDGRGNTCGSCVGQAVALAEAYEHASPSEATA